VTADRAIRYSTVAAVAVVALVAAFISYLHALQVVRLHGESGALAAAYPLTIDGLIYAASMVLLNAARQGSRPHPLAYLALGLGIAATLAANGAAGRAYGPMGALVASWPAGALVISYELLMLVIRSSARAAAPAPAPVPAAGSGVPEPPAGLNGHGHAAAERYAAELARGEVPGIRRIRREMRVGQPRAQEVREYLGRAGPVPQPGPGGRGRPGQRMTLPAGLDARFAWPLFSDIVDVLERHGYRCGGEQEAGRAIDVLADLVRAYEGTGPDTAPEPPAGQPGGKASPG
jgi:Protein of unknown function (DUF2637)